MKAFFNRLAGKDKEKELNVLGKDKFPPLRQWPPQDDSPRPQSTASAIANANFKPLPDLVPSQFISQLTARPLPPIDRADSQDREQSRPDPEISTPKVSRRNTRESSRDQVQPAAVSPDVQKKVAFLSPPQSPTPANFDPDPTPTNSPPPAPLPQKNAISRFQTAHGKDSRPLAPAGTPSSASKTDLAPPAAAVNKNTAKATSTRTASPYLQKSFEAASAPSLRSGTPYSSMSNNSSGSRILAATSWSEVTEGDLVSNLGSRERTRQEVLFEIIQSEDRYVQELIKFKDTFIDPLLHPYATSVAAVASTPNLDYDYYRPETPLESAEELPPIAARFMSPTPGLSVSPTRAHKDNTTTLEPESMDSDEDDEAANRTAKKHDARKSTVSKHDHPRSPYRLGANRSTGRASGTSVPFPSRSHHSLPPPPRHVPTASTHSLGRQSTIMDERDRKYSQGQPEPAPKPTMLRKFKKSQSSAEGVLGNTLAPHQIPEDLRICLEVIDSGVFDGHKRLCEALKKRYDDQYPLVRSLADVFVSNSDIFQGYAKYVLHLERALEQVDNALSNTTTKKPKKQDAADWLKVCKALQKLEENAVDKGETGLAITLSKPFQRLLKYPLLFQNLLFHTDPSTFEYESTLQMVAEVENIVRSIEDEKIQKEERDKTRDVFARIEGLDKVRQLALPKPSRVLVDERVCTPGSSPLNGSSKPGSPPPVMNGKGVRGKSSFKRLSDVLSGSGVGGKKEMWFVVFNDVVLQCQKTGTTSLPLVASMNSRTNSLPDFQGKSKYATTGRRNSYTKPRNLYKFIKIETWTIGDVMQPREGVVSMDDVVRSRSQVISNQPRIVPMPEDKEESDGDSSDSDKKSKMSFSYWGADKITVQKPVIKGKQGPGPRRGAITASYGRESSANAKFGTRLVSDGSSHSRPASRRPGTTTPISRRPVQSEEGPNYSKATVTRPAWDTSTSTRAPPGAVVKRVRNVSQASAATKVTTTTNTPVPVKSPAPSEDSGA
ncbi:Dbl homology domain-containing protein [Coprinopsis marcescibilis]|uniref:Dbl homology domain-containing protein n=1 Tax=Coprinopsis marcescibilis TaxID=230819 RepID=A0A5C3LAR3_COPMA|nr:Dbl homology domain-containing protein [Coprinopsis marcescibilis]